MRKVLVHSDDGKIYEVQRKPGDQVELRELSAGDPHYDNAKSLLGVGVTHGSVDQVSPTVDPDMVINYHLLSLSSLAERHGGH